MMMSGVDIHFSVTLNMNITKNVSTAVYMTVMIKMMTMILITLETVAGNPDADNNNDDQGDDNNDNDDEDDDVDDNSEDDGDGDDHELLLVLSFKGHYFHWRAQLAKQSPFKVHIMFVLVLSIISQFSISMTNRHSGYGCDISVSLFQPTLLYISYCKSCNLVSAYVWVASCYQVEELRLPGLGALDSVCESRDRMPLSTGSMGALLVRWLLSKTYV